MSIRRNEKNAAANGAMSFKNLRHHQEDEDDKDIFSDISVVPQLKKSEPTATKDCNLIANTSTLEPHVQTTSSTLNVQASNCVSTGTLASATSQFSEYFDELLAAVPGPKRAPLKAASEYAKSGLRWTSHNSTTKCESRSSLGNSPPKASDLTNVPKEKSSESPCTATQQLVVTDQSNNGAIRPSLSSASLVQLKQKYDSPSQAESVLPSSSSVDASTVDGKISESASELRQRPRSSAISSSGNRHSFVKPATKSTLRPIQHEKSENGDSAEPDMLARFVVHAFILISRHYIAASVALIMLLAATLLPCPQAMKYFMAGNFFSALVCTFLFLKYIFIPFDEMGIPTKNGDLLIVDASDENTMNMADVAAAPLLWSDMQTWMSQRREIASEPLYRQPRLQVTRDFSGLHEGWMHELDDYDPDKYHINLTFSVHLRLEGNTLILRRPKQRVPKRALWSEPLHFPVTFINSRSYEMRGAEVSLQPTGLRKRQIWNKKYPIAIKLSASAVLAAMSSGLTFAGKAATEVAASVTAADVVAHKPSVVPASTSSTSLSKAGVKRLMDELDYEVVSADEVNFVKLFLFARSDYEKEAWFRRLDAASKGIASNEQMFKSLVEEKNWRLNVPAVAGNLEAHKNNGTNSTTLEHASNNATTLPLDVAFSNVLGKSNSQSLMESTMREFIYYLAPFVPESVAEAPCDPHMLALNALLRRVFWDFFRTDKWKNVVAHRIQSTLDRIKRPNFIEFLNIRELQMGSALPVILEMGTPYMDQSGLWMDVDVAYNSGFSLTICTRVNFLKQKHMKMNAAAEESSGGRFSASRSKTTTTTTAAAAASEMSATPDDGEIDNEKLVNAFDEASTLESTQPSGSDDSGATSGESSTASELEEDATDLSKQSKLKTGKTRKVLGLVQRITQSKGFKKLTDLRVISRGMDFVASKDIVLHVSVLYLRGKLSVNLRPPPSDRLWFGFHDTPFPTFKLKIQPSLGHKVVNVRFLCDWINNKFLEEIQRKIVLPNMVDVPIKLLDSDHPEDWGQSTDVVDFVPKS